ncbi:ribosomal L32p protein family-domain-containing protein [Schizophyllum amplum]|uniref:Large ribosomal subunit protein bL32m n=1 Tax=Schizophyllum amplum TaxID=97359 RepID=A0A550CNH4_9AGAR|nr:ribosomal L32p protein family-domain-containing protein [Auriculariopsis ampla]
MAALALARPAFQLPALRAPLWRPLFASWAISTALPSWRTPSAPSPTWDIRARLQSLLELLPGIVLAVPKKKTSHSKKRMRASGKGLKDKQNIVSCPGCGSPKLAHHLCGKCYGFLSKLWRGKFHRHGDMPDMS